MVGYLFRWTLDGSAWAATGAGAVATTAAVFGPVSCWLGGPGATGRDTTALLVRTRFSSPSSSSTFNRSACTLAILVGPGSLPTTTYEVLELGAVTTRLKESGGAVSGPVGGPNLT